MSFLNDIYTEIETEFNGDVKRSHKAAFYTLMNFIEASDRGSGIKQEELKQRFFHQKAFSTVFEKLINHSVIEQSGDVYKMNTSARELISPEFENLMSILYKPEAKKVSSDPSLNFLYNCRSEMFSS